MTGRKSPTEPPITARIVVDDRSASSPVILHVPHASRFIPRSLRDGFVVPWREVEAELDLLTDASTDRIADAASGASRVEHGLSRLVVDVERFPGDEEEMNQVGMGVLYTHGSRGQEIRRPSEQDRRRLLAYFEAYSTAFADLVGRTLEQQGRAVIIDVHSYPTRPLPYELHTDERRPQLCIGVDDFHTPTVLMNAVGEAFADLDSAENEPFHGAYVPLRYYRRDPSVQSVMLEIRRDLYISEGHPMKSGLDALGAGLRRLVDDLESL